MLTRLRAYLFSSVRHKLLFMVLLPITIVLPLLLLMLVYWGNSFYNRLLILKVNSDLVVAHQYFDRVIQGAGTDIRNMAASYPIVTAISARQLSDLPRQLAAAQRANHLDFLHILDLKGNVIVSSNGRPGQQNYGQWPVIREAAAGHADNQIDIYTPTQLAALVPAMQQQANIPLVPTPNAAPTDRVSETRGMMIQAAAPIYDEQGRQVAILHGGLLLNRNLAFVDRINSIVYQDGSLPLGSKGTATLFLNDVRIATNVRLFQGRRALGTRVSQQVRDQVLGHGKTWLDKAFVVNDWYVSAYEPVMDSHGKRVGMLYVGYLAAPFDRVKQIVLAALLGLFAVVSLIGGLYSLYWARSIFRPLEKMNSTMTEIGRGNLAARVGPQDSQDEIGRLAQHFDLLLDTLKQRNDELKQWAEELDRKVMERTSELARANQHLKDTQKQLVMSEKLAAIGQLTAGVAHEINNPIAVIQGNLDVAREVLGDAALPIHAELRLIEEQVHRIRLLVTKLLQFARPDEFAGYVEDVDPNTTMSDCLILVKHLLRKSEIEIIEDYQTQRQVRMNRNELQQVLINLMTNAIHAMPQGGTLYLSSQAWDDRGVKLLIRDTGKGIRQEDLSRIFDPFYTTKKNEGTGLGLSISYALIERYGGTITVKSHPGQGAEFTVWLLQEPQFLHESDPATIPLA